MNDRYQNQPWWVKLWRRRHYLMIPFIALRLRWFNELDGMDWGVATGMQQIKMRWYYTSEEVWDDLGLEDNDIGTDNELADSGSSKSSDSGTVAV